MVLLGTDASATATAMGGYLATVTSMAENAFVFQLVENDTQYWRAVGGYSQIHWTMARWVSGSARFNATKCQLELGDRRALGVHQLASGMAR